MEIIEIQAKRLGEPNTLHLMKDGKPIGSAVWHRNTQSYRVRTGTNMQWADNLTAARQILEKYEE